jgi:hypothetical protein
MIDRGTIIILGSNIQGARLCKKIKVYADACIRLGNGVTEESIVKKMLEVHNSDHSYFPCPFFVNKDTVD